MHTPLCRHAKGEPTEYAAHAETVGLSEIGFSDHSPMARDDFDDWRMRSDDLVTYVDGVRKAQADHPKLAIRLALEVDYLPGHELWIRELSARHDWDYLIGSVHYIGAGPDSWAIDNPNLLDRWKPEKVNGIWTEYFERLTQAAASGLFDIIGHADLCKKFNHFPTIDCTPLYRRFIEAAAASNTAIELNTAGLRKECHEIYPSLDLLTLARQLNVPITFGSDAHAPGEVGMNFKDAIALAQQAGYTDYSRFEKRTRRTCPLN